MDTIEYIKGEFGLRVGHESGTLTQFKYDYIAVIMPRIPEWPDFMAYPEQEF